MLVVTPRPDLPVDLFDFDLPEDLIALRPVEPRTAARLLVSGADANPTDSSVSALASHLRPGDLLVFNDTKVIPARLLGARTREESEVAMEATLLERLAPDTWRALARPGKRLREGDEVVFGGMRARIAAKEEGGAIQLVFDRGGPALDTAIAEAGVMPLPPYIAARRPADARDNDDYQTILAQRPGAVAAPTAGVAFRRTALRALAGAGIGHATVTLHVGVGTFLPVKAESTAEHVMHSEWGEIAAATAEAINAARAGGGRIVPVGTTALRVLETASSADGRLQPWRGSTDIFISPGYRFKAVDALMTNFHLPRSTLIMLVAALVGTGPDAGGLRPRHGASGMRFYSYGDTSLVSSANEIGNRLRQPFRGMPLSVLTRCLSALREGCAAIP